MGSEEEQKEAFYELQKASIVSGKEMKKRHRRRLIFIFLLLPLFILFVIRLPFFDLLFSQYLRYYEASFYNTELSVTEHIYESSIFGFSLVSNGEHGYFNFDKIDKKIPIQDEVFLFHLNSYACYNPYMKHKYKISCSSRVKNNRMEERHDTKYKMKILKYKYNSSCKYLLGNYELLQSEMITENYWDSKSIDNYSVVYQGNIIEDLTSYVKDIGVYVLQIEFSYGLTKGNIRAGFVNDGEYFIIL